MKRLLLCFAVLLCLAAASAAAAKNKKELRVQGGAKIDVLGFAIDASYDPRLDHLAPGYKVLNVVFINSSLEIVSLNPDKDAWKVRAGKRKKTYPAIIDLRRADPSAWADIPEGARRMLSYPLVVPIGARLVIDMFVDEKTPLHELTEVIADLDSLPTPLHVVVRTE